MGYVINLGFCEVCGKHITQGERFCNKHKNYEGRDDESEERDEEELEDE